MMNHLSAKTVLMHNEIFVWKSSVNYIDPSKLIFWIAKMSSAVRHKTMNKLSQGKIVFITSHQTATRKPVLEEHLNIVLAKCNTDYRCVHKYILKTSTSSTNELFILYSNSISYISLECCY